MPEEPDLSFPDPGNLQSRRGAVPLDRTLDRAVPLGPGCTITREKEVDGASAAGPWRLPRLCSELLSGCEK